VDEFHQPSGFRGGAEVSGEHRHFQVFAHGIPEDGHAEIGGLQRCLPKDFGNAFVDLALVAGRGCAVFDKELFRDTLFNAGLGRQGECMNDGRETHAGGVGADSLQNKLMSVISSNEPGGVAAIRGSATTTAKHWAREMATLTRLRSRMKPSPREPYSP
jgi:hypothetical protein